MPCHVDRSYLTVGFDLSLGFQQMLVVRTKVPPSFFIELTTKSILPYTVHSPVTPYIQLLTNGRAKQVAKGMLR